MTRRVAVIGSGVSGLVAAYVLARDPHAHVTVYEAEDRLGGHADTHEVGALQIDTGFIVHNDRTYPTLTRLFDELGVTTQPSEMSMSVHDQASGLQYAGAMGLRGLFPSPANVGNPRYLRMLGEIRRFHRQANRLLGTPDDVRTLATFLADGGFSAYFCRHFATPLVACVWSCDPEVALDYPARYLFTFLEHHGMLSVFGSPSWRTVSGGSREYVAEVAAGLDEIRLSHKVTDVLQVADGVRVTDSEGTCSSYDAVVVATHPDQALAMLVAPSKEQRQVLGAMRYSANIAQLHTDESVLPRHRRARASWNYQRRVEGDGRVLVTYDLTRLMRLPDAGRRYLVTLNGTDVVDPDSVIATREYAHPIYDRESVAAQQRLPEIGTDRIAFAGAYHGWGFHEDGALSGLRAAEQLGGSWDSPATVIRRHAGVPGRPDRVAGQAPQPPQRGDGFRGRPRGVAGRNLGLGVEASAPNPRFPRPTGESGSALYTTTIQHTRVEPIRNDFTYRSYSWLVDLDDLPRPSGPRGWLLRRLASFEARDHIGDPHRSLRENIDALLDTHGIDLAGGRVQMLANARVLGYVFNPITVFWCHDRCGALAAVVVEVHNTYGGRFAYLCRPDEHGHASVAKRLYVSPFNDTSGHYDIRVPEPGERVLVSVTLKREGQPPFAATLNGVRRPATTRNQLRAAVIMPFAPLVTTTRIRLQGIKLWLRRLPVQPRPPEELR
ncbi:MAG: FAD-dependent oxidoreductase [Actinomycetota bacterium]|nr:FAD-dependent oxidoreductase [Actinomycetota bacterium]